MVTGMRGFGEHLLAMGFATPFLYLSSSYMYPSWEHAQTAVREVADHIRCYGLPREFGPCTFAFTGGGNVSGGAMELFKLLPHEFVTPEELPNLEHNFDNHKVQILRTSDPLLSAGHACVCVCVLRPIGVRCGGADLVFSGTDH